MQKRNHNFREAWAAAGMQSQTQLNNVSKGSSVVKAAVFANEADTLAVSMAAAGRISDVASVFALAQ